MPGRHLPAWSAPTSVRGLVARYRGVPTSAGQTGLMATDSYRGFGVRHDSDAPYQRYQLKYQHAQQGPHGATQGHTKYHQKASIFDLHTPRTEAAAGMPPANQVGDPWLLWHHYRFQERFLDCELLTLVSRCPRWRHAFTCCKRKWLAYLDSSCLN